jgi:hypothetical protein
MALPVGEDERDADRAEADEEPCAQLRQVLDECRLLAVTQAARNGEAPCGG